MGVVRGSRTFSGHPYMSVSRGPLCDSSAILYIIAMKFGMACCHCCGHFSSQISTSCTQLYSPYNSKSKVRNKIRNKIHHSQSLSPQFQQKNDIITTSVSYCYKKLSTLKQVRFLAHPVHWGINIEQIHDTTPNAQLGTHTHTAALNKLTNLLVAFGNTQRVTAARQRFYRN